MAPSTAKGSDEEYDFTDVIDEITFEQILDMDDSPDDREFSQGIVFDFFDQAKNTFDDMDKALKKRDLTQLSSLGHFLKGSSATIGMIHVRDNCEKLQNFGAKKDETGTTDVHDEEKSLENCRKAIDMAKSAFKDAEKVLRHFYS